MMYIFLFKLMHILGSNDNLDANFTKIYTYSINICKIINDNKTNLNKKCVLCWKLDIVANILYILRMNIFLNKIKLEESRKKRNYVDKEAVFYIFFIEMTNIFIILQNAKFHSDGEEVDEFYTLINKIQNNYYEELNNPLTMGKDSKLILEKLINIFTIIDDAILFIVNSENVRNDIKEIYDTIINNINENHEMQNKETILELIGKQYEETLKIYNNIITMFEPAVKITASAA